MNSTKALTGIELVKELNSKRTQGLWLYFESVLHNGKPTKYTIYPNTENRSIGKNICGFETEAYDERVSEYKYDRPTTEANAQYTALAVNNFESVVDALNELMAIYEDAYFELHPHLGTVNTKEFIQAKQAINNIK